jgi:hypothetical protein
MADDQQRSAFISYRRQDSSAPARWLAETIQDAFGAHSVFIDTDVIRVGDKWSDRITEALARASALIVLIGPNWIRIADEYGRRRLDMEDDWVRKEVLHAICHGLVVIPLLVSQASLPVREALPDCLRPLLEHQALELRDHSWEDDRNAVLDRLERTGFRRQRADAVSTLAPYSDVIKAQQCAVFGQQLSALKAALSLVYRARNAARALKDSPEEIERNHSREHLRKLRSLHESIEDLLYEERALLPSDLFKILHELKHHLLAFFAQVEDYRKSRRRNMEDIAKARVKDLEEVYGKLDHDYDSLVRLVQSHVGLGGTSA